MLCFIGLANPTVFCLIFRQTGNGHSLVVNKGNKLHISIQFIENEETHTTFTYSCA